METPVNALCAIERLVTVAHADTEESDAVASFLLAWADSPEHEGFSIRGLRSLSTSVRNDVQAVMNMLFDFGFPSPTKVGVERHIGKIAAFPGQEIMWRRLEKKVSARGPLTADQEGHIKVLTWFYRDAGHSEAAILQRLATQTVEEIKDKVYWYIGFGQISADECEEHIEFLLNASPAM